MKRLFQRMTVLVLAAAVITAQGHGAAAFGQSNGPAKPPAVNGKAPVQGYTRTNRKTGQPEQVKPYKRRLPSRKPVQVQPYLRGGQPVEGHQRRPPSQPSDNHSPADGKKA